MRYSTVFSPDHADPPVTFWLPEVEGHNAVFALKSNLDKVIYKRRIQILQDIRLREVLLEIDVPWLIECIHGMSAPEFLTVLIEKYLKHRDEKPKAQLQADMNSEWIEILQSSTISNCRWEYMKVLAQTQNYLCYEFISTFCDNDGGVEWEALMSYRAALRTC